MTKVARLVLSRFVAAVLIIAFQTHLTVSANPTGPTVSQGRVTFNSQGPVLTIQTSDRAYINWQSFNIGLGETTTFIQPSSSSLVWNRINDSNPSQILGNLNANGYVVLQNQNGFYIGGQAAITAHGLLMTTSPLRMPDLAGGGAWDFNAIPPTASIINYGQINLSEHGSAFLIAHDIENHGTISAPRGNIGLYAGAEVLVSDRPDGRGLSVKVKLPEGSVDNSGRLIADAGRIAMHASVVNQGGLVQANSVRSVNGVIELIASDAINLGPNSVISAQGDAQGISSGGKVVIKSEDSFSDDSTSAINIAGGAHGGNGGDVEISALRMNAIHSTIDGRAARGFTAGKLFIDPLNILLVDYGATAPDGGVVNAGDPPTDDTLVLDVNSFSSTLSQIILQAMNNIELGTLWRLADRADGDVATLSLEAGHNITIDDGAGIAAGRNWNVNMHAGTLLTSAADRTAGQDGIYLNGNSYIQTQNGWINLWAGNELIVNSGESGDVGNNGIRTLAGGSIRATAEFGDINTGGNAQGFISFRNRAPFYRVSPNLGGISTAAGGDVRIEAGGNVISYLPPSTAGSGDAGSGAFGSQAGNVTVIAGGSVFGHFVVGNGTGSIHAGADAGGSDSSQNLALSLIRGEWHVQAGDNIYLQEIRNPNGVYNNANGSSSPAYHLFDYSGLDPTHSAGLFLDAGDGVYLTGLNLPRPSGAVPMIFPPTLDIHTGAGGLTLQDNVILFPSAHGELGIDTAGDFRTAANNPQNGTPELIMSDSARTRWISATDFGDTDHGAVPELNNPNPVTIHVGGNMENVILMTSKQTTIGVDGDMLNCSFSGQNLHPGDVTSINVGGQIFNRSPYSFLILGQGIQNLPVANRPPGSIGSWDSIFGLALDPVALAGLVVPRNLPRNQYAAYASSHAFLLGNNPGFVYNSDTRRLGFNGQMSELVRALFEQPLTVLRYGADGIPIVDANGHFVTDTFRFADAASVEALYVASRGAPSASDPAGLGYVVGGPGTFNVSANSISLGNTYGILTGGVGDPQGKQRFGNLASYTPRGATITVTVDGDLNLLTSTIAALGGGDVYVRSLGGSMDLGSQELFNVSRAFALGIYTTGPHGDVDVRAYGDININGSRIAAYNGGDIHIQSDHGDVDAGSGGTTYVPVSTYYVDPHTHQAAFLGELVFGSGILAATLVDPSLDPGSPIQPGNITVLTPEGDIRASRGGILQTALNGNLKPGPTVTLIAGTFPGGGAPEHEGNIDLGDSGVIGGTVNLQANGDIRGLIISRQNSNIRAAQSFSGTVLSAGSANLSAGGTIAGIVIGVGGVSASGGQGITASLLGQSVSVGGGQAQSTLGTSTTASSTSQAAAQTANTDAKEQVASNAADEDDKKKKKGNGPALARRVGRVTVILPKS